MGTLRSARRTFVASFVALLACAGVVAAAGPVAGSVGSKPVEVRAATAPMSLAAQQLTSAYDARLARTLMVFGDSITARFNDTTGDDLQGFWSMLADDLGVEPRVQAEGGSGFVNPGLVGCTGHTLGQQLGLSGVPTLVAGAGAVVVEGGRTDTQTCAEGGGYDPVSNKRLRKAANRFFERVAALRGADDECTFVLVPWGPAGLDANRERVTTVVSEVATKYGFTFVWTNGLLTEDTTMEDRVHPSYWGNRNLANAVLDAGGMSTCFG
jgi:hypothetical protein